MAVNDKSQDIINQNVSLLDKELQNIVKEDLKSKSGAWVYDTETTGTKDSDVPVTMALTQINENMIQNVEAEIRNALTKNGYNNIRIDSSNNGKGVSFFLDQGNDEANIKAFIKAMTIEDEKRIGKIIDSSLELRKKFLGKNASNNKELSKQEYDQIVNYYNKELKGRMLAPQQLSKIFKDLNISQSQRHTKYGGHSNLYGYNNVSFDNSKMKQWNASYQINSGNSKTAQETKKMQITKDFEKTFSNNNSNDILKMLKDSLKFTRPIGDKKVGDSLIVGSLEKDKTLIGGVTKLQNMIEMLFGHGGENAHEASDDSFNTAQVMIELLKEKGQQALIELQEQIQNAAEEHFKTHPNASFTDADGYYRKWFQKIVRDTTKSIKEKYNSPSKQSAQISPHIKSGSDFIVKRASLVNPASSKKISSLVRHSNSIDNKVKQIKNVLEKQGYNVNFNENSQVFTISDSQGKKSTKIQMPKLVQGQNGMYIKANDRAQQQVNTIMPTIQYETGDNGKVHPVIALQTSQEQAYDDLLGTLTRSASMSSYLQNGDVKSIGHLGQYVVRQSLAGGIGSRTKANNLEVQKDVYGDKNPTQNVTYAGMFNMNNFYRNLSGWLNNVTDENGDSKKTIDKFLASRSPAGIKYTGSYNPYADSYNNDAVIQEFQKAYAIMSAGISQNDPMITNLSNGLTKEILTSVEPEFKSIRSFLQNLIDAGLGMNLQSQKEESFLSGYGYLGSAASLTPFGAIDNLDNRAGYQTQNFQSRRNRGVSNLGSTSVFGSKIGEALGVNYNDAEFKQYQTILADENKMRGAIQTSIKEIEGELSQAVDPNQIQKLEEEKKQLNDIFLSVNEGATILPERMKQELASDRVLQEKQYLNSSNIDFIKNFIGVNTDEFKTWNETAFNSYAKEKGFGTIEITEDNINNFQDQFGDFTLQVGDIIEGLEKINNQYKLTVKRLDTPSESTKVLTQRERLTTRFTSNDVFNRISKNLGGTSKVQRITADQRNNPTAKHFSEQLEGRMNFFIEEAKTLGKSDEEILDILKNSGTLGSTISYDDNTHKFYGNMYYDPQSGKFRNALKKNQNGEDQIIFNSEDEIKKALFETEKDSELSQIGKALLTDKVYQNTIDIISDRINMANESDYFDVSGTGNAETLARNGTRAKRNLREKESIRRTIGAAKNSAKTAEEEKAIQAYEELQNKRLNNKNSNNIEAEKIAKDLEAGVSGYRSSVGYAPNSDKDLQVMARNGKVYYSADGIDWNELEGDYSTVYAEDSMEHGGGVTQEEYKNNIITKLTDLAEKFGKENISFENASSAGTSKKVLIVNEKDEELHPWYDENGNEHVNMRPSASHMAASALLRNVTNAQKAGGEKEGESITKAMDKFVETESTLLETKKDQAEEILVGNSGYGKLTGISNSAYKKDKNGDYRTANGIDTNTVLLSKEDYISRLTYNGSNVEELQAHIQKLEALLKKVQLSDEELAKKNDAIKNKDSQKLAEIIANHSNEVKLFGEFNRYPSTSGRDIHTVKVGIDENLKHGNIGISQGIARTVNGDYDGDKGELALLNLEASKTFNQEQFEQTQQGIQLIEEKEAQITKAMQEWDEAKASKPDDTEEAKQKLVKQLMDQKHASGAVAVASKANKDYVGKFSAISTNIRKFTQEMGRDETSGSGMQAAISMIMRAYTETLEQDSISSKKVAERVLGKNADYNINELDEILSAIQFGDFGKAIDTSESMDMKFSDSRQLKIALETIKAYDKDTYNTLMGQISDEKGTIDKNKLLDLLKGGFSTLIADMQAKNPQFDARSLIQNTQLRKEMIADHNAQIDALTEQEAENAANDIAEKAATKEEQKIKGRSVSFKPTATYDDDHTRVGFYYGNNSVDFSPTQSNSVTELLHYSEMSDFEKEQEWIKKNNPNHIETENEKRARISSNKGTYAHRLVELMGQTGVNSIGSLYGKFSDENTDAFEEAVKARNQMKNKLGAKEYGNTDVEAIERQAEALIALSRREGFVEDENSKVYRERTLGYQFDGSDKALSGQADLIKFEKGKGITVGDYKFSTQGDASTTAERIAQASAYLSLEEKNIVDEYDQIKKALSDGSLQGEDKTNAESKLKEISDEAEMVKSGQPYERKVKILRSWQEKDGQIYQEVVEAEALKAEEIDKILKTSQDNKNIDAKIKELESKRKNNTSQEYQNQVAKDIEALKNQRSVNQYDIDQILSNHYDTRRYDSTGKNLDSNLFNPRGRLSTTTSNKKIINDYLRLMKQNYSAEEGVTRARTKLDGLSGTEYSNQLAVVTAMQNKANKTAEAYEKVKSVLNDAKLSEEERATLQQKEAALSAQHAVNEKQIAASTKQQVSFIEKTINGLKQRMSWMIDSSLGYGIINKFEQGIRNLISYTEQLDQSIVNLQIASGETREELQDTMKEFNSIANDLGTTTTEVASGANEWYRAGYTGNDVTELTRQSTTLADLGMIDTSSATTYLISALKGWKLSVEDVSEVVDKLTSIDMQAAVVDNSRNIW